MKNFSMILKSVVITLIIYIPIMMLFMKKGKFVSKSDELIEYARKEGRIVMGYLIKQELR